MKIKQMHWGYDGGGFGCGPIEGTTVVELCVTTEEENFFIANARCSDYGMIYISPYPLFDLFMRANDSDVDFESENGKIEGLSSNVYDYTLPDDYPTGIDKSVFLPVIKLSFMAMEKCYPMMDPDQASADAFVKDYLDRDLETVPLDDIIFRSEDDLDD